MEHFYEGIKGWFTFPEFYTLVARNMREFRRNVPARFVEIGTYCGRSAAYLAVELATYCPLAKLDIVDNFSQVAESEVRTNLKPAIDAGIIGDNWCDDSANAAKRYADASLDFVFIDADHEYEHVSPDIKAWRPKVKPGGILAGHDFCLDFPGVIRAVTEEFADWSVHRGATSPVHCMPGFAYPVWWVRL